MVRKHLKNLKKVKFFFKRETLNQLKLKTTVSLILSDVLPCIHDACCYSCLRIFDKIIKITMIILIIIIIILLITKCIIIIIII